VLLATN